MRGCYCCSAALSCPALCDPMDCSMPVFPVLQHLLEFGQTHVHWVSGAIQPSHLLLPLNLSQNQGIFQWVGPFHQVTKVLEIQLQHQSFQWIWKGWFLWGLTHLISFLSKGLSRVLTSTATWKHQFFGAQSSLWKAIALTMQTFVGKVMPLLFNTLSRYCWTIRFLASQSQELGVLVIFISHIWTIILSVNTDVVGKKINEWFIIRKNTTFNFLHESSCVSC